MQKTQIPADSEFLETLLAVDLNSRNEEISYK